MSESADPPYISVVVPVFNEQDTLHELYDRLTKVLTADGRPYELIFVDDGSRDRSGEILQHLHSQDRRVRIVVLSRNFGQSPALYAGFSYVRGQQAVMLDADLQNPPEEIPKLLAKLDQGYDVVSGWRTQRQDTVFRRGMSNALNAFIRALTGIPIHDYGCALKAFRRDVVDRLQLFTHRSRYLAMDAAWLGLRIGEVAIEHSGRPSGRSKYGLGKLVRTAFDLITGITGVPIHLVSIVGWFSLLIGLALAAFAGLQGLMRGQLDPLTTITALIVFVAGVQLVATGLMCEYISRIYTEVQARPYFVVRNVIE